MPVGPVSKEDMVTRYVYEHSYYRRSDQTIKPKAFYPNTQGQCSVVVTKDLDHDAVEAYAATYITPHFAKPLLGHAKLLSAAAWDEGLDVFYAEPPPNHANIQRFAEPKEKMIEQAQQLAKAATFRVFGENRSTE